MNFTKGKHYFHQNFYVYLSTSLIEMTVNERKFCLLKRILLRLPLLYPSFQLSYWIYVNLESNWHSQNKYENIYELLSCFCSRQMSPFENSPSIRLLIAFHSRVSKLKNRTMLCVSGVLEHWIFLRNLSLILSQFIYNKTCVQKLKRKLKKEINIANKYILN